MKNEITLTLNAAYARILIDALAIGHDSVMECADREDNRTEEERMRKHAGVISDLIEELERARR